VGAPAAFRNNPRHAIVAGLFSFYNLADTLSSNYVGFDDSRDDKFERS
jgi:hypothetical protein